MQWVMYAGEVRLVRYVFDVSGPYAFKAEALCYALSHSVQALTKHVPVRCVLEQFI